MLTRKQAELLRFIHERLKEAGVADVRIVEKGGDFGGTWYWNRYPGAQCDTASMIYLPLLEETGHVPTERYVHAPEILEHCHRIAKQYGLHENALFHTRVTGLEWDEGASRWIVRTDRGDEFTAQFVSWGTGPLHVPKLPGIPGIETFGGHSFHTSRWDYGYTGGDPEGAPMDRLAGKRVAIIGTGAFSTVARIVYAPGATSRITKLPSACISAPFSTRLKSRDCSMITADDFGGRFTTAPRMLRLGLGVSEKFTGNSSPACSCTGDA